MKLTTIEIRGLTVFGRHGVLPEEMRLGQKFVIDLDVEAEIDVAVATDDYAHAVCYAALCEKTVELVGGAPFKLIETLADRIAARLLADFPSVTRVGVKVHKPAAPIPHPLSGVSVSIERKRLLPVGFSLGSNLGARESFLHTALTWLGTQEGLEIDAISRFYDSAPWGKADQPGFVNACAIGRTSLSPHALLRLCKEIENRLGRLPGVHWGPRAIDIDLLYLGDRTLRDHVLTLPHPFLHERAFVLVPLAEIAPHQRIGGRPVCELLNELPREPGDVTARAGNEETR